MDMYQKSSPRGKSIPLPRLDSVVKNYLLQFYDLPKDLQIPINEAQKLICERIQIKTGKKVKPHMVKYLLDCLKRRQQKFEKFNQELFDGLDWNFDMIEKIPPFLKLSNSPFLDFSSISRALPKLE